MISLLLALTALSSSAFAQDNCPVGANNGERIPRSSRVRVLGIHPEDSAGAALLPEDRGPPQARLFD